jgi:hypothetical protein
MDAMVAWGLGHGVLRIPVCEAGHEPTEMKMMASNMRRTRCPRCDREQRLNRGVFSATNTFRQLLAFLLFMVGGCKGKFICHHLDRTKKQISYLTHNIAALVTDHNTWLFESEYQTWGREGCIVVWDETVLTCKRRYNRGRLTNTCWWAHGGVEIGRDGHIRRAHIFFLSENQGRQAAAILPFIVHLAAPASRVWTDELNIYTQLVGLGYIHGSVKHKKYYVNPKTGVHTNHIEGFWGHIKRMYRARFQSFQGDMETIKERMEFCIFLFLAERRHRHTSGMQELSKLCIIP